MTGRSSLEHRFVRGLRMRTRWEFRTAAGLYAALPTADSLDIAPADGGLLAARQVAALLGGRRPPVGALDLPISLPVSLSGDELRRLVASLLPVGSMSQQVEQPGRAGISHVHRMAGMAELVRNNGLELLRYSAGAQAQHWCLVCGVEVDARGHPSALLLIDSALPDTWACGYNARLEPTRSPGLWVRRSLDGGTTGIKAHEWLAVRL